GRPRQPHGRGRLLGPPRLQRDGRLGGGARQPPRRLVRRVPAVAAPRLPHAARRRARPVPDHRPVVAHRRPPRPAVAARVARLVPRAPARRRLRAARRPRPPLRHRRAGVAALPRLAAAGDAAGPLAPASRPRPRRVRPAPRPRAHVPVRPGAPYAPARPPPPAPP